MKNDEVTELEQSKYCYKGTKVLINKKNIIDKEKLTEVEIGLTAYKISRLYMEEQPFDKKFDLEHYLNIHNYIFNELYDFAGKLRMENIYKSNEPYKEGKTPFCQVPFIKKNLEYTLQDMKNNVRNIHNENDLITFLSSFYLDLNIIHPFREGNGRTLREFMREYVLVLNKIIKFGEYELDYTKMDDENKELLVKASILDDVEEAKKAFSKILVRVDEKEIEKENRI